MATIQDSQVLASSSEQPQAPPMDIVDETESQEPEIVDFPQLASVNLLKRNADTISLADETQDTICLDKVDLTTHNSTLMRKARGLLDIVGPYLEEMELDCPGAGSQFLALISEGVSRAVRGEKIFYNPDKNIPITQSTSPRNKNPWSTKAANTNIKAMSLPMRAPPARPTPPQGQSQEDRRVMIRLAKDHEARKTETFLLRQQIQQIVPDPSLISDAWHTTSGIAILAQTPAKAASILQYKDAIARRFGDATVERQESWTTFIVGPLPKRISTLDGPKDPLDGLLLEEPGLVSIRDNVPIRHVAWTNRSKESADNFGHIRIHIPASKAHKFPSRLQLFGSAMGIQRIRDRKIVPTCEKCHGFHSTRTCARQFKCKQCGAEKHDGPCCQPERCLNCRGPHDSRSIICPARPQRKNGVLVRVSSAQLRHIRKAGHTEYLKVHQAPKCSLAEEEATEASTTSS
ncbi:reverse transcriptase [Thalictrum thalictroides]|uniref:Reverse transcriptase n=1 Tax=Thalictrum thalictroides TaxID=46969 RepID=A0A7J6VG31_THATH|nr:reverse transcriptase [Thalictrum thalictroides]